MGKRSRARKAARLAALQQAAAAEAKKREAPKEKPPVANFTQLEKWDYRCFILSVSVLLINAGFTNAIGMISLGATISHMTGVTTRIGYSLALGNYTQLGVDGATLAAFAAGVFVSSLIIGPKGKFMLNWRYIPCFVGEGIILAILTSGAVPWVAPGLVARVLLALAMGLQNGVTCGWSGGVGRSTHTTGFLSDVFIILAHMVHSLVSSDWWRLSLFAPLYFSFMFGAFLGGIGYSKLGLHALAIPTTVAFLFATGLTIYELVKYNRRKKEARLGTLFDEEKGAVPTPLPTGEIVPMAPLSGDEQFGGNEEEEERKQMQQEVDMFV